MRESFTGKGLLVSVLLAVGLGLLGTSPARAEDEFRCKDTGKIVTKGDPSYSVIAKCRRPDAIFTRIEHRIKKIQSGRRGTGSSSVAEVEEIVHEEWTYDFGQNRLLVIAHFEQDRLISVEFRGYGEKPPSAT